MFKDLQVENQDINIGDLMFWVADVFTTGIQYGSRDDQCSTIIEEGFRRNLFRNFGIYAAKHNVFASDYDRVALQNTTHDINKNVR
jgi:hypothetical protein